MSSKPKILLTNSIHPASQRKLDKFYDVIVAPDTKVETLKMLIKDCDGLIVRCQLPEDIFEGADNLKVVVRHGVGLDFIPVAAATEKKIPVANLPGSNTRAVVEYCLAVIFYFRRRLDQINEKLRHDGWNKARPLADSLSEIESTTIGIVGVGAIGSKISKIAIDLGMDAIGFTRHPDSMPKGIKSVSKAELFKQSDIVIISCSLNDETRGMVDKTMINLMKPTAILINIARGPIVDSTAIVAALKEGRLAGAAMDVHDHHPLEGSELVFNAPNLLLTPHIASITATSLQKMSEGSVDTLLKILQGQRPTNIVNPEVFSN